MSRISLWRIDGNPPRGQFRACSTVNCLPQMQWEGKCVGRQPYRRHSASLKAPLWRVNPCYRVLMHWFGVVQARRTSSNPPEPHYYRDSKVCRVLSHEFWVVRHHRTFSIYIVTGETRCAGCLCTGSGCATRLAPGYAQIKMYVYYRTSGFLAERLVRSTSTIWEKKQVNNPLPPSPSPSPLPIAT